MRKMTIKETTSQAIFSWLIIVGASFFWNYFTFQHSHLELAMQTSRAFFDQIVLDRSWNAGHGGVYVPVTDKTRPNPYLEDPLRDLQTDKGILLTKINPAFMTRQIAEIADLEGGVHFHITSLKPIRPENRATPWENQWLQTFENGAKEKGMFVREDSKTVFRYMAPLITKENCLKCHAKHGYKVGDIRGGISVSLPFFSEANVVPLFWGYGIAAVIGSLVILYFGSLLAKDERKLIEVNRVLEKKIKAQKISELEWSSAMDAYDDVIYLLDMNRHIRRANKRFYQMTASTPKEVIGQHITHVIHPQGEENPCPVCLAQEEKRDAVIVMEADHPDNPAGHPIEITVKIIRDQAGKALSILMNLHDLSNSRSAIEEKLDLEEKLRQAHKMEALGTLAGGIAHDFNNILAAILGFSELAMDDIPEASPAGCNIAQVQKAGNRAKYLVQQILAFSRKEDMERIPIQIHLLVKEAMKLLRASIPTTIEIKHNIANNCGNIMAEPTQIHQILMNLCTNAYQAMDENGGVLTVELTPCELSDEELPREVNFVPGPYIRLTVQDDGVGIAPELLDKIFDPYFTTKEVGNGSGMGLAVVIGIVKGHDGLITVESKPDKGTTFKVYFPVISNKAQENMVEGCPIPIGSERVLVVDDEESVVNITKWRLEGLGYDVVTKTSSQEALELFRAQPRAFDLVISDQTMPELTGVQLAKELFEIRDDIPVIICTGYSSKIDKEKAESLGISVLISKPVEKLELAQAVRQALVSYRDE